MGVLGLVVGVAACGAGHARSSAAGSDELPGSVVVRVGHHSLTKAELEHWTAIEAALTYRTPSTRGIPKGLPDPPDYGGCIAASAAAAGAGDVRPKPTTVQLKAVCRQKHEAIQRHILDILITDYWVSEEAADKKLTVNANEVQRTLKRDFPTQAKFREYLSSTGERPADQRAMIEHQLLLGKLQWRVSPLRGHPFTGPESERMSNEVDLSIARLSEEMRRKWTPRTDCRAGYVVSECRQFRAR